MSTTASTKKLTTSLKASIRNRQETLLNNLAKDFSIDGINKSPARFDVKKLQDINSQFIRMMSLEEFVFRAHCVITKVSIFDDIELNSESPFCFVLEKSRRENATLPVPNHDEITRYCSWYLDKNRVTVLSEIGSESSCITHWQIPDQEIVQWKKSTLPESLANVAMISEFIFDRYESNPHRFPENIDSVEFYLKESSSWWEGELKNWLTTHEYPAGDYLWPLRVALSGQAKSPSPFEILAILTKEEAHRRINSITTRVTSS